MSAIGLSVLHAGFSVAHASGTVTPGSRIGGYNRCASSSIEGVIAAVDAESQTLTMKTAKDGAKTFKADDRTRFRVKGASIATIPAGAKARVSYCTKDQTLVEVRVR